MADSIPLKKKIAAVSENVRIDRLQKIGMTHIILPGPARGYPSSTMAFDTNVSFGSQTFGTNNTFRSNWRTPDVAIQQNKVITTKLPDATVAKGVIQSPVITSPKLVSVPDLAVALQIPGHSGDANIGGGTIQINWHVSASLSDSTAQASFALFRDGIQIAPTVYASTPNNNGKLSVTQTYIDTPGNGVHSYAVYWATSAGTLAADGIGRFIQALPLRPQ